MAAKTFAINTKPHTATIGDKTLSFVPEVIGAEFTDAYTAMAEVQKDVASKGDDLKSEDYAAITLAMRDFLSRMMLPESATVFGDMRLPDRVLVQLVEWCGELYGGGSGKGESTGSSSDS